MNLKDDLLSLKEKLLNIEKEFDNKLTEVEMKEDKFKQVEQKLEEYISTKDQIITLNIGGKKYLTKLSTLLSVKDTLFYKLVNDYIEKKEEIPKEIFFDRSYTFFSFILEFLRTKKFNLKSFNRYDREDILAEIEYYGLTSVLNLNKKCAIDLKWSQGLSKSEAFTIDQDEQTLRVHSTTCYTHFLTDPQFTDENFEVEIEVNVAQTDSYFYIGIVNENYNFNGNCMCCNPSNAYYVQCDGSIHINANRSTDTRFNWGSNKTIIGMKVMLIENQISFYIPDVCEVGPFTLSNGKTWRVVSGHCNTGNGTITILNSYLV